MATTAPPQSHDDHDDGEPTPTALDRRRGALHRATTAATTAEAAVAVLDKELRDTAAALDKDTAALRDARDKVAQLKEDIAQATKSRIQLAKDRKKAHAAATKATHRAATAEGKYDKAVLADMLHKAKQSDQNAHRKAAQVAPTSPAKSTSTIRKSRGPDASTSSTPTTATPATGVRTTTPRPRSSTTTARPRPSKRTTRTTT